MIDIHFRKVQNMYDQLEKYLSRERLEPYLLKCNKNIELAIKTYGVNIEISKSLYPLLDYFEIILRNKCNDKLKKELGDNWFYNNELLSGNNPEKGEKTISEIKKAINKVTKTKEIKRIHNYAITNGDVVSNLEFGFWNNLFSSNYEFKIWLPYLRHLFPNKNRKDLHREIELIRELRNRIFHYEPIIFDNKLKEKYKLIVDFITYITVDNFYDNYVKQLDSFENELKKLGGLLN